MKYARIVDHIVAEIWEHDTIKIDEVHPPEVLSLFTPVSENVDVGWSNFSGTWEAPITLEVTTVNDVPVLPVIIGTVDFLLLFTSKERIALRSAIPTDPTVADFFSIVDDKRLLNVNLSDSATKDAIAYFVKAGFITAERAAQILNNVQPVQ